MWRPRTGTEASTSRQPASRPTSGGLLHDNGSSKEWSEVDGWLKRKYQSEEVPTFERTEEVRRLLLNSARLNESLETIAREALQKFEELSEHYHGEDAVLRETMQFMGIMQQKCAKDKQECLSRLSDLALVLGLSDMSLASFHQGLAQVRLDTLESRQEHAQQQRRLASLKRHRVEAETTLDTLVGLKRRWTDDRESEGDLALRTRRRSTELNKIKAAEDRTVLEDALASRQPQQRQHKKSRPSASEPYGVGSHRLGSGGGSSSSGSSTNVDVEASGLTIAQLDLKEKSVEELQQLLHAQTTSLAAYQEIPPDYALARLKVKEATMRLEELTLEHESLVTQLAEDL
ncbi:hypothetical protein BGZ70_005703 [Mortierella alpina]|uniref:Uncharacterized protein n=1 Tax=Mortierella alpina TaxID=64518 RepID=A0A9P6J8S9_MORAP|nr:hypothetical protein BGZ70_005703 [Mortierella alpina]